MATTYGLTQPPQTIHLLQNNTREVRWTSGNFPRHRLLNFIAFFSQSMSPGSVTGMSPSYSEPSPDYSMLVNQNRLQRPSSKSPPLNNTQNLTTHIGSKSTRARRKKTNGNLIFDIFPLQITLLKLSWVSLFIYCRIIRERFVWRLLFEKSVNQW